MSEGTREPDEPDLEDTVLRPAPGPGAADETEVDEDTLDRRPGAQPPARGDEPDLEDTVLRPASSPYAPADSPLDPDVEDTVARRPWELDHTVAREPAGDGVPTRNGVPGSDDFIEQVPFARTIVPDDAPIQRFDRRPRVGQEEPSTPPVLPAPGPSAGSPSAAAGPSTRSPAAAPAPEPAAGGTGSPAAPPGIDATRAPRRRGLLVPAIAFGCGLLLLLGVGGGLAAVWLGGRDSDPEPVATSSDSAAPSDAEPATEPGVWQPLGDDQVPGGDADQLQQVLADNPLVSAQLPQVDQCALPESAGGAVPEAELQGYLEAGAACLEEMWAGALDPQGIDFEGPAIVVYTVDALPEAAACDPVRFSEASPVVCHDDNTLYWPAAWDPGFSNASAEEAPQLYLWHLSYSYSIFALASADLDGYFGALLIALADDPTRAEEAQRRYALQVSCLSSAAAFGMPDGVRPGGRVAGFVASVEAQAAPATAGEPSPATRAAWVAAGRDGGGSLEACSTWEAAAQAVV